MPGVIYLCAAGIGVLVIIGGMVMWGIGVLLHMGVMVVMGVMVPIGVLVTMGVMVIMPPGEVTPEAACAAPARPTAIRRMPARPRQSNSRRTLLIVLI